MNHVRRIALGLVLGAAFFVVAYWLKCQLMLDTVKSFHLGDHIPAMKNLHHRGADRVLVFEPTADARLPAEVLGDDFEIALFGRDPWVRLWMREPGMVERTFVRDSDSRSRCLEIVSLSGKDWAYPTNTMVAVTPGEVFQYSAHLRLAEGHPQAGLSIVLYDAEKKVIAWNHARRDVVTDSWQAVAETFTVPEGVSWIRLRLWGVGQGRVRVDEVRFEKVRGQGQSQ